MIALKLAPHSDWDSADLFFAIPGKQSENISGLKRRK